MGTMNISRPDSLRSFVDWGLSDRAAQGFIDALEQAYAHIRRQPASGSPRYAHELLLPGLRFWRCTRYP